MSTINMDNVEDSKTSDILPKGEYLTEITGARESEKDGSTSAVIEFTVKGDTVNGKYMDAQFVEFMSLKETALWKLKALIKAALGQVPKGAFDLTAILKSLVGKRISVYTSLEEYKGRDQTRVAQMKPATKFVGGNSKSTTAPASGGKSDDVQV